MSLRPFFAIVIAATMLFSPFAMRSGMAMASAPSDHHARMNAGEHCAPSSGQPKPGTAVDKHRCAAMCANIMLPAAAPAEPIGFAPATTQPATDSIGTSFLAKLPTPPPRVA